MRKFKLRGPIICIAVAVGLLFIKDNFGAVWSIICFIASALTPIIYGFIIAYILNIPYKALKEKVFVKIGKNNKRWQKCINPLSLVCTYLLVLGIISLLIGFIVPQLIDSIAGLVKNSPDYYEQFELNFNMFIDWINNTFGIQIGGITSFSDMISQMIVNLSESDMSKVAENVANTLFPAAIGTASVIYNLVMGIIISIYMLLSKEFLCRQIKRIAVAFIPIKYLPKVYEAVDVMDTKCGRFLVGKVLDSTIIGVICFVTMSVIGLEYALLISVLVAVCNIIPFFGPFISAIPAAFLLLIINPVHCLFFIIMIIVLQQIDGNLIGPKVVGNKVGLIGFWTLFSVIVGGAIFGFPGLILGTPVFAAIYTLFGKRVRNKIEEKGAIAQQALDFEVLKYTEIAEEQKQLRKKKENSSHKNLSKFLQKELEKKKNNTNKEQEEFVSNDIKEVIKDVFSEDDFDNEENKNN